MAEITPRWEWRTFTNDLKKAEENIRKFPEGKTRESAEVYILSEVSMDNTKVRDDLMDIKTLQHVNVPGSLRVPLLRFQQGHPRAEHESRNPRTQHSKCLRMVPRTQHARLTSSLTGTSGATSSTSCNPSYTNA